MIQDRFDKIRGCGWRKPGGLYLVTPRLNAPCCKLPLPLTVCPCCGEGIRLARGWTWVNLNALFPHKRCESELMQCPLKNVGHLHTPPEHFNRVGLIRIGEKYYPEVSDFLEESAELGVSRRITAVPKGFVLGETWVALAHKKAVTTTLLDISEVDGFRIEGSSTIHTPGIFTVFKPTAIEYITTGEETEEVLQNLIERGITPVRIVKPTPRPKPFEEG
jgi:hypothetical protein